MTSKNVRFEWYGNMQEAFESLKKKLATLSELPFPDFEKAFIVEAGASAVAVEAVQFQKRRWKAISCSLCKSSNEHFGAKVFNL